MSLVFFMLIYCAGVFAEKDSVPSEIRLLEQRLTQLNYEDIYTFKNKQVFLKDPYTWVISKKFSERFGMPKEWINEELKGALAVAWRVVNRNYEMCGYKGNPDNCHKPFTCHMDIYVDSKSPIPWNFDNVESDYFYMESTSMAFVPVRPPAPKSLRYLDISGVLGSKGVPFLTTSWQYKSGVVGGGEFIIIHFDRSFSNGVTVLGFDGACPGFMYKGAATLGFYTKEEQMKAGHSFVSNYVHKVDFPENFMLKITSIYEQELERVKKEITHH